MKNRSSFLSRLATLCVVVSLFGQSTALAQTAQQEEKIRIGYNDATGKVSFIGADPSRPISIRSAQIQGLKADSRALAMVSAYAADFGLKNPTSELELMKAEQVDGREVTRFQQVYKGVPIMGGEMIVNANEDAELLSLSGEISPDLSLDINAVISSKQAQMTALELIAKSYQGSQDEFEATAPELWIYDSRLFEPDGTKATLVWRMEVKSRDNMQPVNELVLVDAKRGHIVLNFNQIDTAWAADDVNPPSTPPTEMTPTPVVPAVTSEPVIDQEELEATAIPTTPPAIEDFFAPERMQPLSATIYYVNIATGNDSNSCTSPVAPCQHIQQTINKASNGDTIYISEGLYQGSDAIINITKSITLLGGWDDSYTSQPGTSILDAQGTTSIVLAIRSDANIDRLQMKNGDIGVAIEGPVNVTLRRSAVYGMRDGGIFNRGNLNLENTTISGTKNEGIYVDGGTVNILNSTIINNTFSQTAGSGSGIVNGAGTVNVQNSILTSNTKGGNPSDCVGAITSLGNNLIGTVSGCAITPLLSDIVGANPRVSTFLGSGYHALFWNSPAINAANPGACPALDQRGVARPNGIACDIGSYEYTVVGSAAKIMVQAGESQTAGLNAPLYTPLKALVLDGQGSPVSGKTVTFTAPISGPSGVFSDNGTNQITAISDVNGIASAPPFTTNLISGTYNITASTTGAAVNANFAVANNGLYVKPDGDNNLNCTTPATACATINGALNKAPSNASILVAGGVYTGSVYTGSGFVVVNVDKNISLSGGWNAGFSAQDSQSIIDGQNSQHGIYITSSGSSAIIVNIENFTLKNSSAGIYIVHGSVVNLSQSALLNNSTGIVNRGILKIINVTVSYNSLYGISNYGTLTIQNSTITHNTRGINSDYLATTNIQNSILAKNFIGSQAADCKVISVDEIISNGYNIIGSTSGCPIVTQATDRIGVNPWLSPLLNDGSHALYANSPAINTANAATCPSTDQRNVGRPIGAGCDIGSVEYPGPGTVPAYIFMYTGSPQLIRLNTAASPVLKAVVLDENGGGVSGVTVTFTAPSSGPSGIFLDTNTITSTAITDANGIATPSTFTANNKVGIYILYATVAGVASSADFQLVNGMEVKTYTADYNNLPGTFLCDQNNFACTGGANLAADQAHQFALGTYQFYNDIHDRQSMDDNNMTVISSVKYAFDYEGNQNAVWNGTQMIFGKSSAISDDVVAHEYTHGVTQYESGLFYYYQSGAINESFSDFWGELYDQQNGLGNDTTNVKWLISEDASDLPDRSMSNPPAFGDPDKMTSANYFTGTTDNGGVHTNSGINNKAAFLMVEGGSFNGKTVTALEASKTLAIYYEVQTNLLTSGSDYSDLYYALYQGCLNLVGGTAGVIAEDCLQVRNATDAVQMNLQPVANFNSDAPLCDANTMINNIFLDDLESGTSNWAMVNGDYPRWQYGSPYGEYAHSGTNFLYANDYPSTITDAYVRLKPITIPANGYLHFAHAYDFEKYTNDPYYYDGGVLEYSTNNGASWVDAWPLIMNNSYTGTIYPNWNNPLRGRIAFVGSSHGYISTLLNLSSLAGQSVSFRWRMGLDDSGLRWGWWLDDVRIYNCAPIPWVGSVSVESDKNVVAVGRPHVGSEVASYDSFSAGALSAYVPMLFKDAFGGSYDSALYVQNVDPVDTANITIKYYDSAGALSCTVSGETVAPLASKGYWVPSQGCLPAGWIGGVVVTSDQPIVAIGRPHIGAEVMTYNSFSEGSLSSYIPMLFKDAFGGSYDSAFYVQNVDPTNTAAITIKYYDSAGVLSCTVSGETIAPFASKGYWVPGESCLPVGWVGGVVVTSDQPIVTVGRPHIGTQVTTYNGFSGGTNASYVPMLFKDAFGGSYDAAFYVQNVDPTNTASITIQYYDSAGVLSCTVTGETVAPLASKGYWVPSVGCLPAGWVGGVVVTSDQPVVAVGRPHIGAQVTTYNGFTTGNLSSYLPMLFKDAFGGSYDSAFYIQNTEASTAAVTIKFYDSAGVLTCTRNENVAAFATLGLWLPSITCLK